MVGFDLVGQEELGRPLIDFVEPLLKMPEHINFYFHAGETNWFGSPIDENLVDAILMGTKRIGHGFALTKHPMMMRLAKLLDIAIEVCPVSKAEMRWAPFCAWGVGGGAVLTNVRPIDTFGVTHFVG